MSSIRDELFHLSTMAVDKIQTAVKRMSNKDITRAKTTNRGITKRSINRLEFNEG